MSQEMASFAQQYELLAAIVRQFSKIGERIPAEHARYLTQNKEKLSGALLAALLGTVWRTLIAACRQTWVSSGFNEEHFPLESVAPDEADWEVYEHHFDQPIEGEEAFRRLEEMGYRLCGPRRAMEFIVAHPDIQLDHPLVITARWQERGRHWSAPFFFRCGAEREVYLRHLVGVFGPDAGWLVLRKRQKS